MADTITQTMEVSLPGAGKIQTYALTADTPVKFMFDLSDAIFTGVNGNLEIVVEGGGTVILENYQALAEAGTLPTFETFDGEQIAGEVYLFAFGEDVEGVTQEDLETAAGAAASGSGAGEYSDDAGTLYDGLDALGGQDDAYDSTAIEPLEEIIPAILEEEEERIPPVAVDDDNETVEEGQDYGESIYTSFDQIPFTSIVEGNLLFNDYDDDNIGYEDQDPSYQQTPPDPLGIIELEVNSIDFEGEDQDGLNPGPVSVEAGGTTVKGLYGELTVYPNGEYSYVLDQELADPLRDGQEITEVFPYNIIDPDGLVSNTATLTILITGTNDPPVAINDTSALVTEEGPEVVGVAVAAGNVLHNDWDVDNVGYEDLPLEYRDQLPPDPDGLVELSVTSIYNPVTHQYDSTPDSGAFTVEGMYGTLVINTDGSYEYTLDQSKADPLAQDERAVDTFQYSMWDGQLSSYANLNIPIIGTNDAPVAVDNIDSVYEPNVDALAILAAGNVITDSYDHDSDPSTPAVDFDVDDPSGLSLQDVTYGGVTKVFGVNEEPGQTYIQFTTDNGVVRFWSDGEYEYTATNDALDLGDAPVEAFDYTLTDGSLTDTATLNITVHGLNDPPSLDLDDDLGGVNYVGTYTENDPAVALTDSSIIADVDEQALISKATISYTPLETEDESALNLNLTGDWQAVRSESGGVVTWTVTNTGGDQSLAAFQAVLDGMTFGNPADEDPMAGDRVFTFIVYDEHDAASNPATSTITVEAVNDAPVAVDNIDSVYEPNVDALAILAAGNVITDSYDHDSDPSTPAVDFDVDDPSGLSLQDVTYGGVTKVFGVNEEPGQTYIQFTTDNGVVRFWSDGEYEYTATNDALDLGDAPVEAFDYTLTDGSLTDTATLNITVHGLNDPPSLDLDDDLGGVNYVGTYTENDPAVALTDSSIIADVDEQALISKATISYTPLETEDESALNLNLTGDWQAVRSESGGVVTWTITNTGGDQSLAAFQAVLDGMTFGNPADEDPMAGDRVFTVTVYDEHDAASNPATSTITVEAVNDPPVAVHDGYHEISIDLVPLEGFDQFQGFNGHQHVEDNMYFLAQSDSGGDIQMRTAEGSGNQLLGVLNDFGSGSVDEHSVDTINGNDSLFVQFIEPQKGAQPDPEDVPFLREGQARIEVHLQETGYAPFNGASVDIYVLDPSDTNPADGQDIMYYKTVEFSSLDFTLDSAVHNDGHLIYGVVLKPSGLGSAFWLDGIFSGPPEYELNLGSAANNSGEVEGNLLLNDFDIEDPASLLVTEVDGTSVPGSGNVVIDGTYGRLTIEADGDYWYKPYDANDPSLPADAEPWQSLPNSVVEVFNYTVADGGAQIDTGFLEFSINLGTEHIEGGTAPDPLMGTNIDDVIFPADADVIYSGAGSDSIVIDPDYLGGNGDTIDIMDFSDSDRLSLGNMEGASVLITSTSTDIQLQFSDIDGSDDIVVNLMGVNPVDNDHFELVNITTSEDLNNIIQTIIDTGNNGIV